MWYLCVALGIFCVFTAFALLDFLDDLDIHMLLMMLVVGFVASAVGPISGVMLLIKEIRQRNL